MLVAAAIKAAYLSSCNLYGRVRTLCDKKKSISVPCSEGPLSK